MSLLNVEAILRIGACGCFIGHGWIAAMKLEFSGWKKFLFSAGFSEAEAHVLMPIIGWMDVLLALATLIRPVELFSAWMTAWAFSTALVCVGIKIIRRVLAELPRRPPRHRRDACSMAW